MRISWTVIQGLSRHPIDLSSFGHYDNSINVAITAVTTSNRESEMKGQTKYARVRQGIIHLIASESLVPGQQLPTEKELAKHFDASILTVRHALGQLAEKKIVRREQGRGTFVNTNIADIPTTGVVAILLVGKANRASSMDAVNRRLVQSALAKRGCEFREFSVGARPSRDAIRSLQDVSGVIATGWLSLSWISVLSSLSIPVVIAGDSCTDKPCPPTMTYNWSRLSALMGDHLVARGAKRLGLLTAGDGYAPSFAMRQGYQECLAAHGMSYDPADVLFAEGAERGLDVVAFLDSHRHLDGFLVEGGFYQQVLAYLLDRPQRPLLGVLSVIPPFGPMPASVSFSSFEENIFAQSVELLFELIQSTDTVVSDRIIEPRLYIHPESVHEE